VISAGAVERAEEVVHPDYVSHGAGGAVTHGLEGFRQQIMLFKTGFPDLLIRAVDVLVHDDRVAWRVDGTGTHTGPFMGVPATSREVTFRGLFMARVSADGRILENWSAVDLLGVLMQLGATGMTPSQAGLGRA